VSSLSPAGAAREALHSQLSAGESRRTHDCRYVFGLMWSLVGEVALARREMNGQLIAPPADGARTLGALPENCQNKQPTQPT